MTDRTLIKGGIVLTQDPRARRDEERPVHQMPYSVYAESVKRIREFLSALSLMVPFS